MHAYIYAYADRAFVTTPALDFPLTYTRGSNLDWAYWLNKQTFNPNNQQDTRQKDGKWAQPWLTDITFDHGDMILALRDRNADQFGTAAGGLLHGCHSIQWYFARRHSPRLREWQRWLELGVQRYLWRQSTNSQNIDADPGPGGKAYYFMDRQLETDGKTIQHHETSEGSQLQIPGLPTLFRPFLTRLT